MGWLALAFLGVKSLKTSAIQVLSKGHIPVFYYPSNKPLSPRQFLEFEAQVDTILARHGGQISVPALKELMTEVSVGFLPALLY